MNSLTLSTLLLYRIHDHSHRYFSQLSLIYISHEPKLMAKHQDIRDLKHRRRMGVTTSKTAVGLGRGRRPRRASACKQSRILANINLKLSKTYVMSSFQELQDLFLLSYRNVTIDNNEFSVLHEEIIPQNPYFSH